MNECKSVWERTFGETPTAEECEGALPPQCTSENKRLAEMYFAVRQADPGHRSEELRRKENLDAALRERDDLLKQLEKAEAEHMAVEAWKRDIVDYGDRKALREICRIHARRSPHLGKVLGIDISKEKLGDELI